MERGAADEDVIFVEPRWPIALALSSFIVLTVVLRLVEPESESLGPHWLAPAIEVGLLLALIAANPAHLVGGGRWLRPLSISLIGLLAAVGLFSTVVLISDIVREQGDRVGGFAARLRGADLARQRPDLRPALLGARQRRPVGPLRHERPYPDFVFTQQGSEFAPPDWRTRYVDYFVLGISTSMAFSPTDVMPMTPWAKLTMTLQSVVSLTVIGLVVARAVNAFT